MTQLSTEAGISPEMYETLTKGGFILLRQVGEHGLCGIHRFMHTYSILSGLNRYGYEDRWCYNDLIVATEALREWSEDPEAPEPDGWHRHLTSGRRRPEGDADREYVVVGFGKVR